MMSRYHIIPKSGLWNILVYDINLNYPDIHLVSNFLRPHSVFAFHPSLYQTWLSKYKDSYINMVLTQCKEFYESFLTDMSHLSYQ